MKQIIKQICRRHFVTPEALFSGDKSEESIAARRDAIRQLSGLGLNAPGIAKAVRCHEQTVYYWLNPKRRQIMRTKSAEMHRLKSVGGKRQTREQRREILNAYLEDPARGTALACRRGLSPLYAYKLAHAMGALPKAGEK